MRALLACVFVLPSPQPSPAGGIGGRKASEQQRRHLAPVPPDQVLVLDHPERIDQCLARQAFGVSRGRAAASPGTAPGRPRHRRRPRGGRRAGGVRAGRRGCCAMAASSTAVGGASLSSAAKPRRERARTARSSVARLAGRASSSCSASCAAPVLSSARARSSLSSALSGAAATSLRRRTTSSCGSSAGAAASAASGSAAAPGSMPWCLRNSRIWPSGSAPGKPSTSCPSLTRNTVGIERTWNAPASCGSLSTSTLASSKAPLIVRRELLQDRPERLARTAPLRPEIDQHRRLQGFLQYLRLEVVGGGVEDVGRGGIGGHRRRLVRSLRRQWGRPACLAAAAAHASMRR